MAGRDDSLQAISVPTQMNKTSVINNRLCHYCKREGHWKSACPGLLSRQIGQGVRLSQDLHASANLDSLAEQFQRFLASQQGKEFPPQVSLKFTIPPLRCDVNTPLKGSPPHQVKTGGITTATAIGQQWLM